jgi:hypothetical protein
LLNLTKIFNKIIYKFILTIELVVGPNLNKKYLIYNLYFINTLSSLKNTTEMQSQKHTLVNENMVPFFFQKNFSPFYLITYRCCSSTLRRIHLKRKVAQKKRKKENIKCTISPRGTFFSHSWHALSSRCVHSAWLSFPRQALLCSHELQVTHALKSRKYNYVFLLRVESLNVKLK